ncbi:MAG: hypothetical protein ISN29_01970 [Gammaproteobacteria bacterium AqS3]|nr:hypothetical protein [Gammaproteobacteria bacterium AqS3]
MAVALPDYKKQICGDDTTCSAADRRHHGIIKNKFVAIAKRQPVHMAVRKNKEPDQIINDLAGLVGMQDPLVVVTRFPLKLILSSPQ